MVKPHDYAEQGDQPSRACGMTIDQHKIVTHVLPGSPAATAGISQGLQQIAEMLEYFDKVFSRYDDPQH